MTTHFITAAVALRDSPAAMRHAIEAELQRHGDPLRWAVTHVKVTEQTAIVEAIVTKQAEV